MKFLAMVIGKDLKMYSIYHIDIAKKGKQKDFFCHMLNICNHKINCLDNTISFFTITSPNACMEL